MDIETLTIFMAHFNGLFILNFQQKHMSSTTDKQNFYNILYKLQSDT